MHNTEPVKCVMENVFYLCSRVLSKYNLIAIPVQWFSGHGTTAETVIMTLIFKSLRAVVMTFSCAKVLGQQLVGSEVLKCAGRWMEPVT